MILTVTVLLNTVLQKGHVFSSNSFRRQTENQIQNFSCLLVILFPTLQKLYYNVYINI
jgi:hypothetical protein